MTGLFKDINNMPLAERLRPKKLDDVVGQENLLSDNGALFHAINNEKIPSIILWGTPGCGKTTIARLIAENANCPFETVSAVFSGVSDLRKIFDKAIQNIEMGKQTILFVDEIHRFNKAQQDSFLPYVENGTVILIGATTQNPSFELNSALLSRTQVFTLNKLTPVDMEKLLLRAENLMKKTVPLDEDARKKLCEISDGDGRYFLNMVDMLMGINIDKQMNSEQLLNIVQRRMPVYDKSGDSHYNMLSAFHKSMRGSDVQASLYWMGRMLAGGEDPLSIARRMLCIAYEDIGLADPMASQQAIWAWDTFKRLGSPEGERALVQACVYLATAPKSNAIDKATKAMLKAGREQANYSPPKNILNAPTKMMENMGYGKDYQYDHNHPDGFSGQNFFPEELGRLELYTVGDKGFEKEIKKRYDYYEELRRIRNKK
ncbi:MAG: replication-associated recombination protein A [Alphaproteobacteria bacterium]|nr:replication-associated recombination protein A [Alphaproteobacteria bacterium]